MKPFGRNKCSFSDRMCSRWLVMYLKPLLFKIRIKRFPLQPKQCKQAIEPVEEVTAPLVSGAVRRHIPGDPAPDLTRPLVNPPRPDRASSVGPFQH